MLFVDRAGLVKYLYLDTDYLDEEEADSVVEREIRKRERRRRNKTPKISDDVLKLRCLRALLGKTQSNAYTMSVLVFDD